MPVDWKRLLDLRNMTTILALLGQTRTHSQALLREWQLNGKNRSRGDRPVTHNELQTLMSRVSILGQTASRHGRYCQANVVQHDDDKPLDLAESTRIEDLGDKNTLEIGPVVDLDESWLGTVGVVPRKLFKVARSRPRDPPTGGYPFPRDKAN
jgi:hypothetical protein